MRGCLSRPPLFFSYVELLFEFEILSAAVPLLLCLESKRRMKVVPCTVEKWSKPFIALN